MNRILSKKQEICSQIMALDIEQLEELTDMIEIGAIPGMTTPKVALTCRRCEKTLRRLQRKQGRMYQKV